MIDVVVEMPLADDEEAHPRRDAADERAHGETTAYVELGLGVRSGVCRRDGANLR